MHLSEKRVQGIQDLPIPTSVSAVRSFVGMVNYFRDFIPALSSYLYPLTELTKKLKFGENGFEMTEDALSAFVRVKDMVMAHTTRVLMNDSDPFILYTDASTRAVGGVLMQVQGGREKPCVFVSHTLSEQATRWGVMEQELFAFVFCVKTLSPYLLGKLFTVRTDHKNLVFLSNSTVPKLVRWRVVLSEYRFQIEHIPGAQNVVADGLTRIFHLDLKKISPSVRYCFKDDSTQRIFRMDESQLEFQKSVSSDSEDEELEVINPQDEDSEVRFQKASAIFEKFHNSVVGHLGCDRTYKPSNFQDTTGLE